MENLLKLILILVVTFSSTIGRIINPIKYPRVEKSPHNYVYTHPENKSNKYKTPTTITIIPAQKTTLENTTKANTSTSTIELTLTDKEVEKILENKVLEPPSYLDKQQIDNIFRSLPASGFGPPCEKGIAFVYSIKGNKFNETYLGEPINHPAVDGACAKTDYIAATALGVVIFYGNIDQMPLDFQRIHKSDGNTLIMLHKKDNNQCFSVYGHLAASFKKPGEYAEAGERIGIWGNTGNNSTGRHLHFVIVCETNNRLGYLNPAKLFDIPGKR